MKAGDLVRYYKDTVATEDGETYFYKKCDIAVVVEDYEPWTKIIKIYSEGTIKVVHISEVNTLKRGSGWTQSEEAKND
jgi:hypothetical protein